MHPRLFAHSPELDALVQGFFLAIIVDYHVGFYSSYVTGPSHQTNKSAKLGKLVVNHAEKTIPFLGLFSLMDLGLGMWAGSPASNLVPCTFSIQ